MARAALVWNKVALAKNLPHRSREHEFTDGRVGRFLTQKDDVSFTSLDGFGETVAPPACFKHEKTPPEGGAF